MNEPDEKGRERIPAWHLGLLLLMLVTVYLFSYAPVVRMRGGWKTIRTTDGFGNPATVRAPIYSEDLPIYRPADWLIDNTPLQDVLYWWADVWGVRSSFSEAAMWRPRGTFAKLRPAPAFTP